MPVARQLCSPITGSTTRLFEITRQVRKWSKTCVEMLLFAIYLFCNKAPQGGQTLDPENAACVHLLGGLLRLNSPTL